METKKFPFMLFTMVEGLFILRTNKGERKNELVRSKIIINDNVDEIKELEYLENVAQYKNNVFKAMIYATNACNLRCIYCTQPHVSTSLEPIIENRIIKLIDYKSKECKQIELDWFGGEPLLEYDMICRIMNQAKEICNKNHCNLVGSIITNGYLLSKKKIRNLRSLNISWMQITIDGNEEIHDKRRVGVNKEKTYKKILENILAVLQEGIRVTLRINIDKENIMNYSDILDAIPIEKRKFVTISVCNIFQNKEKLSTFEIIKGAINKGYRYSERWNRYVGCHASMNNACVVDTDGSLRICSNTTDGEKRIGFIDEEGKIVYERKNDFYQLQTVSAIDSPRCKTCIQLPFCIATCKYARTKNENLCLGKRNDGLSLEERALLDYEYDCYKLKN